MSYRTHRSSGYGHESLTELPEVPGIVTRAYRFYRSSGYGYECRTQLAEVLCTGLDVVQNSQKFRVRVIPGKIHALGGGVRFEVKDLIVARSHSTNVPEVIRS